MVKIVWFNITYNIIIIYILEDMYSFKLLLIIIYNPKWFQIRFYMCKIIISLFWNNIKLFNKSYSN
jgi:hypothetical protein